LWLTPFGTTQRGLGLVEHGCIVLLHSTSCRHPHWTAWSTNIETSNDWRHRHHYCQRRRRHLRLIRHWHSQPLLRQSPAAAAVKETISLVFSLPMTFIRLLLLTCHQDIHCCCCCGSALCQACWLP